MDNKSNLSTTNINNVYKGVKNNLVINNTPLITSYDRLLLIITSINYNSITQNIDSIDISVEGRVNKTNLDSNTVRVMRSHNNQCFERVIVDNFVKNSAFSSATLDLTKISDYDINDIYLIQIIDAYDNKNYISDKVSVNLATLFFGHTATVPYIAPEQAGNYIIKTVKLNDESFTITSDSFLVGPAPDENHSLISIDKPNFVKFSGQVLNITVELNNLNGNAIEGPYEIVYATKLQ